MNNKFEAIKDKARKMIHEDAKHDSHIIKERNADRAKITMRTSGGQATPFDNLAPSYGSNGTNLSTIQENYSEDNNERLYEAMDQRMQQYNAKKTMSSQTYQQTGTPTQINKSLPKEILESFSNNYIDQSIFNPDRPVLDRIGVTDGYQEINEVVTQQQTNYDNAGKIDYEIIKNIVEGTVKKYMNAATKKILTENKTNIDNSIGAIQFTGDKFVVVTKSGDLYEAKMVFKKNVSKK